MAINETLVDDLQRSLKDARDEAKEMREESASLAQSLRNNYAAQLREKDKQIAILQSLVADLGPRSSGAFEDAGSSQPADDEHEPERESHHVTRPLHHDYLVTVLEERDSLADRLHDTSEELLRIKAALATTSFEKEQQAVRLRRLEREIESGGSERLVSPPKPPRGRAAALAEAEEQLAETRHALELTEAKLQHYQRTERIQRRKDSARFGDLKAARDQVSERHSHHPSCRAIRCPLKTVAKLVSMSSPLFDHGDNCRGAKHALMAQAVRKRATDGESEVNRKEGERKER